MTNSVLGFMALHYAGEYYRESLMSIKDHIDKMHIVFSKGPSHGMSTSFQNPDTEYLLHKIATEVLGNKLIWETYDSFHTEQDHRKMRYKHSIGYRFILTIDADEIFDNIPQAILYAIDNEERFYGITGYKHFWKSFDYYFTDPDRPIRIEKLTATNQNINPGCPLIVYHTSMMQPESMIRYKFSVFGHKNELKPNYIQKWFDWTPEKIAELTHLHPTRDDIWIIPEKRDFELPEYLINHKSEPKNRMKILYIPMDYHRHVEDPMLFQDILDGLNTVAEARIFTGETGVGSFRPDVVIMQPQETLPPTKVRRLKENWGNPLWLFYTGDCGYAPPLGLTAYKAVANGYLVPFSGRLLDIYQRLLGKPCHFLWESIQNWRFIPNRNLTPDHPITFVGNVYSNLPGGKERLEIIDFLRDHVHSSILPMGSGEGFIGPIDYKAVPDMYNNAYITICENNYWNAEDYFTPRNLGAMSAGSCALMKWFPGIEKFFPNLSSCIWYHDKYELLQWIQYLQQNPDFRNHIAESGYKRAAAAFTTKHWAENLLSIIKTHYIR